MSKKPSPQNMFNLSQKNYTGHSKKLSFDNGCVLYVYYYTNKIEVITPLERITCRSRRHLKVVIALHKNDTTIQW
jgi:hypothetical protein